MPDHQLQSSADEGGSPPRNNRIAAGEQSDGADLNSLVILDETGSSSQVLSVLEVFEELIASKLQLTIEDNLAEPPIARLRKSESDTRAKQIAIHYGSSPKIIELVNKRLSAAEDALQQRTPVLIRVENVSDSNLFPFTKQLLARFVMCTKTYHNAISIRSGSIKLHVVP